jgi:hypothetical protein
MMNHLTRLLITIPLLAAGLLLAVPDPAYGQHGRGMRRSAFYYSSPANILRGQLALERSGHLDRGSYEPGRYDPPTRDRLRSYQRKHSLRSTGRFDRDTFATLPVDDRPDKDDDGIPDADDRCPSTKKGTRVGFDGCPLSAERPETQSPAGTGGQTD